MKMLLVGFAFASALVTSSSSASIMRFDRPANIQAARPLAAEDRKAHATRIDGVDDQLSDQERMVIAFLSLKADAERGTR
jgi:hypothetical protein